MSASQFDKMIQDSQDTVKASKAKISSVTSQLDTAREKIEAGEDIGFDIENATLDDVQAHSDLMNANIAELIMGLDDTTAAFSKDFDGMRSKSSWENFVGFFSKGSLNQCGKSEFAGRISTISCKT